MTGAPRLHEDIRGLLNRLRALRNELAHDGKPETPLKQRDAAELLVAAVFGFHYAQLLHAEVEKAQRDKRLPTPQVESSKVAPS
jgi:hypothetical protein